MPDPSGRSWDGRVGGGGGPGGLGFLEDFYRFRPGVRRQVAAHIMARFTVTLDQVLIGSFESVQSLKGTGGTATHRPVRIRLTGKATVEADHHQGEGEGVRDVCRERS